MGPVASTYVFIASGFQASRDAEPISHTIASGTMTQLGCRSIDRAQGTRKSRPLLAPVDGDVFQDITQAGLILTQLEVNPLMDGIEPIVSTQR
ncbi:hypothetical protein AOQ73_05765 [Bradyrhizobium pachyrhizi]|nr:hypothetical protein AOQ73_05765 [Bradyrhizobium pachyrhizi]